MRPYHERPRVAERNEASMSLTSKSSFHEVVTTEDGEEDQQDESDTEASQVETSDIDAPEFTVQFKAWLKSADRGKLAEKTREQHGKQISKLLKVIDSKQETTSFLTLKSSMINFWKDMQNTNTTPKPLNPI